MKLNAQLIKSGIRHATKFTVKHAPTIMVGLGVILSGVAMYESSTSAVEVVEEYERVQKEEKRELTKKEKAKIIFKKCWKAFLIWLISIGMFAGAHKISLKRQAALGAMYAVTMKDFKEYKDTVIETLGEKKAEKVEEDIAAKRIQEFDIASYGTIPGNGPLWIDKWSNRPFRGDLETIRRVINDLNDDIYQCHGKAYFSGEITLNDVYNALSVELGTPNLGPVAWGDSIGFRADLTGPIDVKDIYYSKAANGEPCGYINFKPQLLTENVRDLNY